MSPDSTNTNPPLDASVVQRHAADPHASVWVNASAGTGKTKTTKEVIDSKGAVGDKIKFVVPPRAEAEELGAEAAKRHVTCSHVDCHSKNSRQTTLR